MFFIVSTGRSGTVSIARILSDVKGCTCLHEPAPELIRESSGYRYGEVSADAIREILRETRHPKVDGDVYCESNQTLSLIIPLLVEEFPEARFIWLVRNGLDVVASTYQKQWYTGHSENHDRYEDCTDLQKAWIDGRIHGDRCGDVTAPEWADMDRFAKCCWYWGYVNGVIGEDLERHAPGRYFTLRLEDLGERIVDLLAWMGFGGDQAPEIAIANMGKQGPHHWTSWSEAELAAFERWCGGQMDAHYPGWHEVVGGDSARLFVAPVIRALSAKAGETRQLARVTRRAERAEGRLHWIEGHWTFPWYRRLRRLLGDRGPGQS